MFSKKINGAWKSVFSLKAKEDGAWSSLTNTNNTMKGKTNGTWRLIRHPAFRTVKYQIPTSGGSYTNHYSYVYGSNHDGLSFSRYVNISGVYVAHFVMGSFSAVSGDKFSGKYRMSATNSGTITDENKISQYCAVYLVYNPSQMTFSDSTSDPANCITKLYSYTGNGSRAYPDEKTVSHTFTSNYSDVGIYLKNYYSISSGLTENVYHNTQTNMWSMSVTLSGVTTSSIEPPYDYVE